MSATEHGSNPIAAGTSIAHYRVVSRLGSGGMGDVYRAHDGRLNRDVAIKVLRGQWMTHDDRVSRFRREAQLLASLNHPNIGQIYGLEEFDGTCALVMELVDGPTLADRIAGSRLRVVDALQIASKIAEALETAHHQGIIHRDLKPSNIKLREDGIVKVLDFGLAKLVESTASGTGSASMSPTISLPGTLAGVILGTAAYMAPEQARGKPVDRRADIWSFGCVLYELLTGRRAFGGEDIGETLALVITKEPEWSALPAEVPAPIRKVLRRCLEKDRNRRFADIGDVRLDIDEALTAGPDAVAVQTLAPAASRSSRRLLTIGSLVAAALIALAFWIGQRRAAPATAPPVARFLVNVAPADRLLAAPEDRDAGEGRPSRTAMTWSPDGRSIVFSAAEGDRQQLYIRAIDQLRATPLSGTQGGAMPFVSPDGRWVGFWSSGALRKVPIDGSGPATTIVETATVPYGATWGADDTIIFSRGYDGLWRVLATGGTAQAVITPDKTKGELKFLSPQLLPGDEGILFTVIHTPFPAWEDDTEVVVHVLATGERKVLVRGGADARYLPSGHLLYLRKSTLMAVPFDLQQLAATSGPVALIADVMQSANTPNEVFEGGAGQFSVSATGSLLYAPGGTFPDPERSLAWVDRNGSAEPLPLTSRSYASPRLSPDGRRLLVWTQGDRHVWVHDLARGVTTRLTSEGRNARAIWTPDGRRITYASTTAGAENLFWRPSDGSGTADRLASSESQQAPGAWTPDGKTLVFIQGNVAAGYDILTRSLDGDPSPRPFLQTPFNEQYADLSADGHWLAYVSNQSGRAEVYVQPFPGPGARQQISVDGGTAPAWSRNGRELFYTTTTSVGGQAALTTMMAVPVQPGPTFIAGTPRMLFQGRFGATANIRAYDVSPDGRRFLMVQQQERPAMRLSGMVIVQNWVEELKDKVRPK
jgi:serine/threonine-protein kinase